MFFLLSPAKNLNEQRALLFPEFSQPQLLGQAKHLISQLKKLAPHEIASLMGISDKLALLNAQRFAQWQPPFTPDNAKQAVYLFDGDVYAGLQADSLPDQAIRYLQQHLGILSGLYGVLRPLDLIQPYRLEMGTKLPNSQGANLYAFWGKQIAETIRKMMHAAKDTMLINLASQEYFKAVPSGICGHPVITPIFKDRKNGQYKIISFYAKRARGLMVRYAAQNQLHNADDLKAFDSEGYYFDPAASDEHQWVFLREEHHK